MNELIGVKINLFNLRNSSEGFWSKINIILQENTDKLNEDKEQLKRIVSTQKEKITNSTSINNENLSEIKNLNSKRLDLQTECNNYENVSIHKNLDKQ